MSEVIRHIPEETILLSECFPTIQGESSFVGVPTIFIRLYSCNLRCAWCDSVYAVEGGDFREVTVDALVARVHELGLANGEERHGMSHICWTGGEPLLQWRSVARVIKVLPSRVIHTVETDGEVDLAPFDHAMEEERTAGRVRFIMDIKCPGSHVAAKRAFENLRLLRKEDEVKFVILDRRDYEFARDAVWNTTIPAGTILFSAVAPANSVATGLSPSSLAQWMLDDRVNVRLQVQLHKYVWPGIERGV